MNLKPFQINALNKLFEACEDDYTTHIVLKSSTGSGKTIMLTRFIKDFCRQHKNIVFIWLTPGKGNLEEQSKKKMDDYIPESHTKLLSDVFTTGFEDGDACFINWELLTKKDNIALKDSERENFEDRVNKAHREGLRFFVVIDESHQNNTDKAKVILDILAPKKIIRASATPKITERDKLIDIDEADVIAQQLIKKLIIINEDFPQKMEDVDLVEYLLEKALKKQQEIHAEFLKRNVLVNPLILVQLPNSDDSMKKHVEEFFAKNDITFENGQLAKWLSDASEKINLSGIEKNNAVPVALIMKQAIATGWDCPRSHILVKLRPQAGDEPTTFDIQTIGRIRRMPQAIHYNSDLLDSCYLYSFDTTFVSQVRASLGDKAVDARLLHLKDEYKEFTLQKQQRKDVETGDKRDIRKTTKSIAQYIKKKYSLSNNAEENKTRLETEGFEVGSKVVDKAKSGVASLLSHLETKQNDFNEVDFFSEVNTHGAHGLAYKHAVHVIGKEIGLEYSQANTIVRKIFCNLPPFTDKVLKLPIRDLYAFVINNQDDIRYAVREAMAADLSGEEPSLGLEQIVYHDFHFPQSEIMTYKGDVPIQVEFTKNVYGGYLSSAIRSNPEKKFEKFLDSFDKVNWWYKNGDKGEQYFSVVYLDNGAKQKLFYPDYVLDMNGEIWICETKGGFTTTGHSEDIDIYSSKKFEVLKQYVKENKLHGGFVRYDADSDELFIATEKYSEEFDANCWKQLKDVWKR